MTSDSKEGAPGAPSDEARAKFREALERKQASRHRTAEGDRNTGAVHGSETAGPMQQRTFRRKSG
ncbi:DUF5302 domain-containing protein [Paraoerskovia marina]|uniref:DUF5302 domain-containing protein n=1 Tax=Paraoerskovia marina TaxID=545619 RepID=A0A1H1TSS8_9CELL|nr:DUF5302 domain-containing protein [Paraoerskovia marina]SDS63385.1 hypothetical protein SAMN04489860_1993 [Paraoerskovia marina]